MISNFNTDIVYVDSVSMSSVLCDFPLRSLVNVTYVLMFD